MAEARGVVTAASKHPPALTSTTRVEADPTAAADAADVADAADASTAAAAAVIAAAAASDDAFSVQGSSACFAAQFGH